MATARQVLVAGLAGEAAFEAYAWWLSPDLFGVTLQPAFLVIAIVSKAAGFSLSYPVGCAIHLAFGAVGVPLALLAVRRLSGLGMFPGALVTGIILWFVAQGLLAPYIGRSFMMGFGAYAQTSFVAHVGMLLVVGLVFRLQGKK